MVDTWSAGLEVPQYLERQISEYKHSANFPLPRRESPQVIRAKPVNDLQVVPVADSPLIAVDVEGGEPEL